MALHAKNAAPTSPDASASGSAGAGAGAEPHAAQTSSSAPDASPGGRSSPAFDDLTDLTLDFEGDDIDAADLPLERDPGHDAPLRATAHSADSAPELGARVDGEGRAGAAGRGRGRRIGMRVGPGKWIEAEEGEGGGSSDGGGSSEEEEEEAVGRVREARVRSLIEEEEGGEEGIGAGVGAGGSV